MLDDNQDKDQPVDGIGLGDPTAGDQTGQSLAKILKEGHPHWSGLSDEEIAEDITVVGNAMRQDKLTVEAWRKAEADRVKIKTAYEEAGLDVPENLRNPAEPPKGAEYDLHQAMEDGADGKPLFDLEVSDQGKQIRAWELEYGDEGTKVIGQFLAANPLIHQRLISLPTQAERTTALYDLCVQIIGEHLRATSTPRKVGL